MKKQRENRKKIRLRDYDYATPGMYFLTICAFKGECLFGKIVRCEIRQNEYGKIVSECWNHLPIYYRNVRLDCFTVMPNHVHGIIMLLDVGEGFKPSLTGSDDAGFVGEGFKPSPTKDAKVHGIPEIVRGFKTFSVKNINEMREKPGVPVWQRSYYDHVVRNEKSLEKIREYVLNNPLKWHLDNENRSRTGINSFYNWLENVKDKPRRGGFLTLPPQEK